MCSLDRPSSGLIVDIYFVSCGDDAGTGWINIAALAPPEHIAKLGIKRRVLVSRPDSRRTRSPRRTYGNQEGDSPNDEGQTHHMPAIIAPKLGQVYGQKVDCFLAKK